MYSLNFIFARCTFGTHEKKMFGEQLSSTIEGPCVDPCGAINLPTRDQADLSKQREQDLTCKRFSTMTLFYFCKVITKMVSLQYLFLREKEKNFSLPFQSLSDRVQWCRKTPMSTQLASILRKWADFFVPE